MNENDTTHATPAERARTKLQWQAPTCTEIDYTATEFGPPGAFPIDDFVTYT